MRIVLKSFDGDPYDRCIQENILKGLDVAFILSVADHQDLLPNVPGAQHKWVNAYHQRKGDYRGFDWTGFAPLDEALIESMRHYEAMFMTMVTRYAVTGDISYRDRKRQYLDHLRFWNHTLTADRIDLVLMNHPPHQCYDYVLYGLCKVRGIPLLYLERNHTIDALFAVRDWEESAAYFGKRLDELYAAYPEGAPVPLSENYELYYRFYKDKKPQPWYRPANEDPAKKSFWQRWGVIAVRTLLKKPRLFFRSVFSAAFWVRKLGQHRALHLYDKHVREPDLTKPYVYFPLHYQPEATTWPQSGAFGDQELMVQLLSACLPAGVQILIKEHPNQGEICRNEAFYSALLALPNVVFVPKAMDTYTLIDSAVCVASGVGSAIFEGMMRSKPSIMFGHFFYQYAKTVHCVRSVEDCKRAVKKIFEEGAAVTDRDIRLFLKATDETGTIFEGPPMSPVEKHTQQEKSEIMGAYIRRHLLELYPQAKK